MKILFADAVDTTRVTTLEAAGHQCRVDPGVSADQLPSTIGDAEILVVRSTQVSAEAIQAGADLAMIVRAGAGTDNIDKSAASDAGVYVCNVPGRNAIAVAELTMGLLLAIDRHIADGAVDLRNGVWNKARYTKADGLAGKTLSIIGLGDIGLAVAERAKAFDLIVQAERRPGRSDAALTRIRSTGIRLLDNKDELLGSSDIVSIHVPKADDTTGLVNEAFVAALPDGCIILNTSRGNVVDESALLAGLDHRNMRAGLDVFANEPSSSMGTFTSALAAHPAVVGSHHIGASTTQAQESVADGMVEVIDAYARGAVINCVNLATETSAATCLSIRHLDRVGVLAKVLNALSRNGHNVEQMQNQVFTGGGAAVATINVDGSISEATLGEIGNIDEVLAISVTADERS
jgi:D-3-phosphoglycerate dehydrogenase